jgi:regulator of nucleoside diphosphate kinase
MLESTIEITETDAQRLRRLLTCLAARPGASRDAQGLLRDKLDHSWVVSPGQVGSRVVTLRSRVVVMDEETWEARTYTLVLPEHVNGHSARLSVLTPMGMAILGRREGDVVAWGAQCTCRIQKVLYQPESAGHEFLKDSMPQT